MATGTGIAPIKYHYSVNRKFRGPCILTMRTVTFRVAPLSVLLVLRHFIDCRSRTCAVFVSNSTTTTLTSRRAARRTTSAVCLFAAHDQLRRDWSERERASGVAGYTDVALCLLVGGARICETIQTHARYYRVKISDAGRSMRSRHIR